MTFNDPGATSNTLYGEFYTLSTFATIDDILYVIGKTSHVRGWVYTRKYHATRTNAYAEIEGGYIGSSVSRLGPGVWESTKKTKGADASATGW